MIIKLQSRSSGRHGGMKVTDTPTVPTETRPGKEV